MELKGCWYSWEERQKLRNSRELLGAGNNIRCFGLIINYTGVFTFWIVIQFNMYGVLFFAIFLYYANKKFTLKKIAPNQKHFTCVPRTKMFYPCVLSTRAYWLNSPWCSPAFYRKDIFVQIKHMSLCLKFYLSFGRENTFWDKMLLGIYFE